MSLGSKESVPIPSCIYEGHLYLRTENKKWKWRLFQFDGSQLSSGQEGWCVGIEQIATVSLLRKAKRAPSCFSILTVKGERHVLKARRTKDLERWLFVLSRMWTLAQTRLLSDEKCKVIEAWRASLTELMTSDPDIQQAPPAIEPIPEDDNLSIFSDMTSISRRPVKRIVRRRRSTRILPLLEETSTLKKRRSDDVRHWMGQPALQPPREGKRMTKEEEEEISLAELMKQLQVGQIKPSCVKQ